MNLKRIRALLLAATMLCSLALFSACGGENAVTDPTYKVSIVDAMGAPCTSGVVVKFMQNGTQAAMQVVDENGVAEKVLPKGDYTVELQFTDSDVNYSYDDSDLTLTADKTELQIVLSFTLPEEGQNLFAGGKEHTAYPVSVGATNVKLDAAERTYYLFAPTEAGTYEFSLLNSDAAIGYYGAPHFVQENSAAEVADNKFTISIRADMIGTSNTGTAVLVIGIDAGEGDAILGIQRIGDPEWTVEDEPWTIYETTAKLATYKLPTGAKLGEFDLKASTDTYKLVLNETDGFYHLDSADGPLVLMRLGEKSGGSKYLDPFEVILEHSGISKYFYDENGEFVKREKYDDCLLEYFEYMDEETGLYPLTEDLKYILQQRGDYSGWWNPDESLYLFVDENRNKIVGINNEIAWLFMCCYIEQ